jgi:L-amino acid N-acyltransferase YncA
MTGAIVHGALWANDLTRLPRLDPNRGNYRLTETRVRVAELADTMKVPVSGVRERLERGSHAFVARSRTDGVAGWMWVSTGGEWAPPLRRGLRFASDECWGWDVHVLPQHRDGGLCACLLRYAGRQMAQQGYHWMWNGIEDSNLVSQRAHVAAGFRPVLHVTAVHEPPPTRLRVRPTDYADERLVERACRQLGTATFAPPDSLGDGSSRELLDYLQAALAGRVGGYPVDVGSSAGDDHEDRMAGVVGVEHGADVA